MREPFAIGILVTALLVATFAAGTAVGKRQGQRGYQAAALELAHQLVDEAGKDSRSHELNLTLDRIDALAYERCRAMLQQWQNGEP